MEGASASALNVYDYDYDEMPHRALYFGVSSPKDRARLDGPEFAFARRLFEAERPPLPARLAGRLKRHWSQYVLRTRS